MKEGIIVDILNQNIQIMHYHKVEAADKVAIRVLKEICKQDIDIKYHDLVKKLNPRRNHTLNTINQLIFAGY